MNLLDAGMQFKDEYKQRNAELEKENERLRHENSQLFCTALNERDARIAELEDLENVLKLQVTSLDSQYRSDTSYFPAFKFQLTSANVGRFIFKVLSLSDS